MIQLLIFDLDGTLIDSAPDIINVVNLIKIQRQQPTLPDEKIKAAIGHGMRHLLSELFPETTDRELLERDYHDTYKAHLTEHTRIYDGVENFLAQSHRTHAIATNKLEDLAQLTVQQLLGKHPWLRIFGSNSLTRQKPDPLPLEECMRAAGVNPAQTVMIGDGIPDMQAARAAGIRAIGVTFGYSTEADLKTAGANALLRSYADLPKLLEKFEREAAPVREN